MTQAFQQSRATEIWRRLGGMFGADAVTRKFGQTPPPEWQAMLSRLKDFEVDRGIRRLAYSGKSHVPSLPEFTKLCRMVADDDVDEGPRPPSLPAPEGKFDGWDVRGNDRFLKYIGHHLVENFRPWGEAWTGEHAECTKIAVRYKNAWTQDMRERYGINIDDTIAPLDEYQLNTFAECMRRAEVDITAYRRTIA